MALYGNVNLNKKRKGKKIIIAVIIIAVLIIAGIFYIGIVAGGNGEDMQRISSAVEENTQLKLEIDELNTQIAELNEEIDDLKSQLASVPAATAVTPTPEATPEATADANSEKPTSPRSGVSKNTND